MSGWDPAVTTLPAGPTVLAVDGPATMDWAAVVGNLSKALAERGTPVEHLDLSAQLAPWPGIVERTASAGLSQDPDFERLAAGSLADLFDAVPEPPSQSEGVVIVFGPGAALVEHDVLWYVDLPKRYAEAAIVSGDGRNLGQREGDGRPTTKRLFYIDWPLLDRHRDAVAPHIDRWIDVQDATGPVSVDGLTLRRTIAHLAQRPFRTRPTFNTTSWGGHWAQRELGINREASNTALGYELIAPESGVLIGRPGVQVEVPFQLVVALHPQQVLGEQVHATFGTLFPIRFDYLDTVDGGNLSVHCHPRPEYMREVFGWPYTQHETYYMMVGGEGRKVYLGLRDGVDVDAFAQEARAADRHGLPFDIEQYVQTFPAVAHQLFVIPAGTPHGSGEGNVVLEVSATPYLYSLRFYDWLRRDPQNGQRPVHVDHAFNNLGTDRTGDKVRTDLVQPPRIVREDRRGWREELLGALPEMFFEVRRVVIDCDEPAEDDTAGRFHILNVVEGDGVLVETASGHRHSLAYAETLVVPAAVGTYTLHRLGSARVLLVKSLVP
ncbi:class I mannose-6-phosphate isomerase [Micromonospora sp. DT47]|uniref:class I mannose-6-phosphate isomerase n=1 Tax=Micromonospora sp. DT47 TaxID=3393431 RepID=UPI003CE6C4F3